MLLWHSIDYHQRYHRNRSHIDRMLQVIPELKSASHLLNNICRDLVHTRAKRIHEVIRVRFADANICILQLCSSMLMKLAEDGEAGPETSSDTRMAGWEPVGPASLAAGLPAHPIH
jgi:hypothetical protein